MLHFVQHDSLEVIRHAEFQAKSCVTVLQSRGRRAKKGPSHGFEVVFVRDGARNATKTPESGTVTQNFRQKVA